MGEKGGSGDQGGVYSQGFSSCSVNAAASEMKL